MTTRIALLKPDYGVIGGFERVVEHVEATLLEAGFDVVRHTLDVTDPFGANPARAFEGADRELETHLHAIDRFDGLHTSAHDLVISTLQPSFAHRHRRHLSLFYHHHRIFYDLEGMFVAAGFARDAAAHHAAAGFVRSVDRPRLGSVGGFLCPSATVARRLARFNGVVSTMPFHAGVGVGADGDAGSFDGMPPSGTAGALCVSRHEFPKRSELVVAAAHLIDRTVTVTCTGTGGRLAWARQVDSRCASGRIDPVTVDPMQLWCNVGAVSEPDEPKEPQRVSFVGHVDDRSLEHLYGTNRCVVAPAFDEDYGLTAIEAMRFGRPVIVCSDGGGLAELVEDGVTGLVVEPTPSAIAAAIDRLHGDDALADELGANARERAADFSWRRAERQLLDAVTAVLDAPPREI